MSLCEISCTIYVFLPLFGWFLTTSQLIINKQLQTRRHRVPVPRRVLNDAPVEDGRMESKKSELLF